MYVLCSVVEERMYEISALNERERVGRAESREIKSFGVSYVIQYPRGRPYRGQGDPGLLTGDAFPEQSVFLRPCAQTCESGTYTES